MMTKTAGSRLANQKGMGMVGWLVTILIVGMVFSQVLKLFPAYLEYYSLSKELTEMAELPDGVEELSNKEIDTRLNNFFRVNRVSKEADESLKITRDSGDVVINMEYQRKIPMFANITALLDFHLQLDSKFPDKCCSPRDK